MAFDPIEFIETKKDGMKHRPKEIQEFIRLLVSGDLPEYQAAAWLMAVIFNGLAFSETLALTQAMATSGKVYKWDTDGPPVVDKHSTGGVGDTVTLVVAPLVAAMGMRMGKHSGRGLGHTGGTIDKLESIPGFRTSLTEKEFRKIVNRVGCGVAGQDKSMTPADGILYSLRDVTSTVDQEALIASSIMSKKLAGGAMHILLEVKVGSGAFMKDPESARSLSKLMIRLGMASGRNVRTVLSSMSSPLGRAVGNALEVREAIKVLKNDTPDDDPLKRIAIEIAARLASMCGFGKIHQTRSRARSCLAGGAALSRFRDMVSAQGGDEAVIDQPEKILPHAGKILEIPSTSNGFLKTCNALIIGELVRDLGGGRKSKNDVIDSSVGILIHSRPGMKVGSGDVLCEIHTNGRISNSEAVQRAESAFKVVSRKPEIPDLFI